MSPNNLSPDQKFVLDALLRWQANPTNQFITVGGFAGTGKTTLLTEFREQLYKKNKKLKIAFCSYTGKASRVLEQYLKESKTIQKQDSVSTIHSLIYSPVVDSKTKEILGWDKKEEMKADLIIIDEASMVDEQIWADLLSYKLPVIAVGDHGQLPPINGSFNLMQNPKLKLEKIHRQAEGNPIIRLSMIARQTGEIPFVEFSSQVKKLDKRNSETGEFMDDLLQGFNEDTLILCGYNHTRVKLNKYIRQIKEFHNQEPQAGDRVICLRNNHKKQIFNGMLGKITHIEGDSDELYYAEIDGIDSDISFQGPILKEQFNATQPLNFTKKRRKTIPADLFDFGYALTVHKAQGSQALRVILFEERFSKMDDEMWRRWLYTGVTRAQEELFIVA